MKKGAAVLVSLFLLSSFFFSGSPSDEVADGAQTMTESGEFQMRVQAEQEELRVQLRYTGQEETVQIMTDGPLIRGTIVHRDGSESVVTQGGSARTYVFSRENWVVYRIPVPSGEAVIVESTFISDGQRNLLTAEVETSNGQQGAAQETKERGEG
ncbi:hypothetical protein [Alkalicoccus urumqiensis]|uniref:Uncharacterized protein n=1 Tax=Alkalicoccus urumqiensis TaxID=1548213 RepID=A0A2P6MEL7_ALKUR|nr:hypothetical protein [Alkalicoccus urumqiensis]PRO64718.1 hypothetical protein C6I21_13510 [Alkalicoccus urumqiensis]